MSPEEQKLRSGAQAKYAECKVILNAALAAERMPTEAEHATIAAKKRESGEMILAADAMSSIENGLVEFDKPIQRNSGRTVIDTEEGAIDREDISAVTRIQRVGTNRIPKAIAHKAGMFAAAVAMLTKGSCPIRFSHRMQQKCHDMFGPLAQHSEGDTNYIVPKSSVQIEGSDIPGGNLVFPEFDTTIINLREVFGTFRRNTAIKTMTSDTKNILRRTSALQMYLVGEAQKITTSSKKWDLIKLVAKKCGAIALSSVELNEDSAVDLGNDLMSELAYCAALGEDQAGWNGDGSSGGATEYLGMTGVRYKLKNLNATISKIYGLTVGSGTGNTTNYSGIVLSDINAVIANLPAYADTPSCKFYCHRAFYYGVLQKLAAAAGGVTFHEIIEGVRRPMFLGYPVEFVQAFPKTAAASQVCLLFGDLTLASKMGQRKGLEFAVSQDATIADGATTYNLWQNDMMAWRMIERFDINVHDIGRETDGYPTATATIDIPGAGPIVGLITAAS